MDVVSAAVDLCAIYKILTSDGYGEHSVTQGTSTFKVSLLVLLLVSNWSHRWLEDVSDRLDQCPTREGPN